MIYCVEDDNSIRELMVYALRTSGFDAEGFGDGTGFFAAVDREMPELVMLDIMLPGMDGLEILRRIRGNPATAHLPVIMATAKGTEFDKVTGLDSGADDYLCKPFGMMEMVSHIRAVLRRVKPVVQKQLLRVGELEMNPQEHTVRVRGAAVQLTLKEYELLRLFLMNPGRAFTRDQLLVKIWGMDYMGESRTVDVHIGTLRTKLGACGEHIRTIRGVGYRLEERL